MMELSIFDFSDSIGETTKVRKHPSARTKSKNVTVRSKME